MSIQPSFEDIARSSAPSSQVRYLVVQVTTSRAGGFSPERPRPGVRGRSRRKSLLLGGGFLGKALDDRIES